MAKWRMIEFMEFRGEESLHELNAYINENQIPIADIYKLQPAGLDSNGNVIYLLIHYRKKK